MHEMSPNMVNIVISISYGVTFKLGSTPLQFYWPIHVLIISKAQHFKQVCFFEPFELFFWINWTTYVQD